MMVKQSNRSSDPIIDAPIASPTAAASSSSNLDSSTQADGSLLTRIRSHSKSSTAVNSLAIHRTATRESHQSGGSGDTSHSGGLSGLISNTRSLFKRHNRSGSISTPSPTDSSASVNAVEAAGFAGPTMTTTATGGSESRRLATGSGSGTAAPTSIQLPPPLVPNRVASPPRPSLGPTQALSDGAHSSSDNYTATSSSSSSIPHGGGYSSATTVSDVEQPSHEQLDPSSPSNPIGSSSRDFALPPGAAAMPLSTEARYRALPRLQSYSVTHPEAGPSSSRGSEDGDGAEYDTTTSMSGTETEHDEESDADEGEEEEEDDEEDEDEHEHNEEDVRGGVNAMRTALRRPALPTLSSSRGFSRTGTTPGISPTTNTNPFNFSGWTTFASSTPTPGPLRTARPQSGDNTVNGSYFDPRPTSSSSRTSTGTVFQTPAQTPRVDNGTPGNSGSNGKSRQQSVTIPTPGATISPPSSRIRMDSSRPSSGSPLAAGRKPSAGTFVKTANGQAVPSSAIPPIAGLSFANARTLAENRSSISNRPSFYQRQSKSLVDLSRSLEADPELPIAPTPRAKGSITAVSGEPNMLFYCIRGPSTPKQSSGFL